MKKASTSDRLKQLMTERNLKQVDILRLSYPLCTKWGVKMNKSDISQYVSGKVEPSQEKLVVLGYALNVTEAWLMGFDVPMNREHTLIDSDKDYSFYQKYSLLSERDKKIIVHMVDSMLAEKNNTLSTDTEDAEASYIKNRSNSVKKMGLSVSNTTDGTVTQKEVSNQ